jgi:hypothetical protein
MRSISLLAPLSLALVLWSAAPATAQDIAPAPPPSCLSDWSCGTASVRVPLGLYVRAVDAGGRYLTLEDGSLWEVEISDRATTGSWQPDDFVGIRTIAAPRGDFDILLTRVGDREQRAAARLAGRRNVAFRSTDSLPDGHGQE